MSLYKIQSPAQHKLIEMLRKKNPLILKPGDPPIQFELMGHLNLQIGPEADKLLICTEEVRQVLSIQWSEIRLAQMHDQELQLSDGERIRLRIQSVNNLKDLNGRGLLQDLPRPLQHPIRLALPNGWALEPIAPTDRWAYLLHLNNPEMYQHTLNIPYPYTEKHADHWLALVDLRQCRLGQASQLALRHPEGDLAGGIGLHFSHYHLPLPHQAELGYWLAKPFWGKGIMTQAVRIFCNWAMQSFELERIQAHIFKDNKASEQVLLKTGFQLEGQMTHHYLKEGQLHDGKLYALLNLNQ